MRRVLLSICLVLGALVGPTTTAAYASTDYWAIQTLATDSVTGKHLCITSGSAGGWTELVDCNTSTAQQWAPVESGIGVIWVSRAVPGYAMSWSSLSVPSTCKSNAISTCPHLSLAKASGANHNEIWVAGEPEPDTYWHIRPAYLSSRCAGPADADYRQNYAPLYPLPCNTSSAGSQSFSTVYKGVH